MKKIFICILGIPLAIGLLYGVSFIFKIILNLFLLKETANTILPSWLTYIFDIIAAVIAIFVLKCKQNGKRFEIVTTIITFILTVIASHIAKYSWLYFMIFCLAIVCGILKLIRNIIESQPIQKES